MLREEYLAVMRFNFNNINFDDYQDKSYFSNYDLNKDNAPNPLQYSLDFGNLTLEVQDLFEDS